MVETAYISGNFIVFHAEQVWMSRLKSHCIMYTTFASGSGKPETTSGGSKTDVDIIDFQS